MKKISEDFLNYMKNYNPSMAEKLASDFSENKQANIDNKITFKREVAANEFRDGVSKEASVRGSAPSQIDFNFLPTDTHIKDEMLKTAGILIHDSTPEAIENFLIEYTRNELSFFPDKIDLAVNIVPMDVQQDPINRGQVDMNIINCTGTVDVKYKGKLIQLPFIMQDKEILPFDSIQMGSQAAVYTRDNIRNILFNLKGLMDKGPNVASAGQQAPNVDSYVGTAKRMNNLTDPGFMGNMLAIQSVMGGSMKPMGVYSSIIEDLLEKTANMHRTTKDFAKIETLLKKDMKEHLDKMASEAMSTEEPLEKNAEFEGLYNTPLADVRILGSGVKFRFMEKNGSILDNSLGAVFDGLVGFGSIMPGSRMLITSDYRFRILKPGEPFSFVAKNEDIAMFDFKERDSQALNPGYLYTGTVGKTKLIPFTVTNVTSGNEKGLKLDHVYRCYDINGQYFDLIFDPNMPTNQIVMTTKDKVLGKLLEGDMPHHMAEYNVLFHKRRPIMILSTNTKFMQLDPSDINDIKSMKEAMYAFDENVKLAYLGDRLEVVLISGSKPYRYNLGVSWYDQKFKTMKGTVLQNIDELRLKGSLRTIGYDYNKIVEIVTRANREGMASYEVTPEISPWLLKPDTGIANAARETVDNLKKGFFDKNNAAKAIGNALGNVAANIAGALGQGDVLSGFASYASESEALANKLEKIAMAKRSAEFTKLAGLMVIKNRIDNMVLDAYKNDVLYEGHEVLANLADIDEYLSKTAYDLVELKLKQAMTRNEIVSPNVINAALRHIDGLHKYAMEFNNKK